MEASRDERVIVLGAVLLVFIGGFLAEAPTRAAKYTIGDFRVSLDTDKATYGSREPMRIAVFVESPARVGNATLRVWGIKPGSTAHVDQTYTVNLEKGGNSFFFTAMTPYCTAGCGGVYPGPYAITAELTVGGKTTSNSTVINLTSA